MLWLVIAGVVVVHLAIGLFSSSMRAWFIGKHRIMHGGMRSSYCEHWACGLFATDSLTAMILFWPIIVPVQLCNLFIERVLHGPYLRSLPPVNTSSEEIVTRELIDAVLQLGSVEHFCGKGQYDPKWNRLDKALKAYQERLKPRG